MSPDRIDTIVTKNFPSLLRKPRNRPDGWSYYYGAAVVGGKKSNRIFRAIANSKTQDSRIKLSVSARLKGVEEFKFTGSETELIDLIAHEISIFKNELASS